MDIKTVLNRDISFENISLGETNDFYRTLTDYEIPYRGTLHLPTVLSFGLELEYENALYEEVTRETSSLPFKNVQESSVMQVSSEQGMNKGGELVSDIFYDKKSTWELLEQTLIVLKKTNAEALEKTASHIHIGANILKTTTEWLNFLTIFSFYEDIIYRFSYGEENTYRRTGFMFAAISGEHIKKNIDRLEKLAPNYFEFIYFLKKKVFKGRRNYGLNVQRVNPFGFPFNECYHTIEFRTPNGTLNPVIIQNNVNLFSHLLLCSKSPSFDRFPLQNKLKASRDDTFSYDNYQAIHELKALEFADLIFDNSLDKINFLAQYYKQGEREPDFSKKLVKTNIKKV